MSNWQVLRRPERFTELYFADPGRLPTAAPTETAQTVSFVIHNLEYQAITYRYTAVAVAASNAAKATLGSGTLTLGSDQSRVVTQNLVLPSQSGRMAVEIDLDYVGFVPGSTTAQPETQSIRYWLNLTANKSEGQS